MTDLNIEVEFTRQDLRIIQQYEKLDTSVREEAEVEYPHVYDMAELLLRKFKEAEAAEVQL